MNAAEYYKFVDKNRGNVAVVKFDGKHYTYFYSDGRVLDGINYCVFSLHPPCWEKIEEAEAALII